VHNLEIYFSSLQSQGEGHGNSLSMWQDCMLAKSHLEGGGGEGEYGK
jgi:hypothetical protein